MSDTIIISGVVDCRPDEVNSEIARQWATRNHFGRDGGIGYLYDWMLRGIIADRQRWASMRDIPEDDFLHGVYLALCDHFNGGCEIEDMSPTVADMLHLPVQMRYAHVG
jgi:hypothetical protein